MKTLYITDLDGTLLHSDATLSEYEIAKIKEFHENDILFSVATARSMITGGMLLKDIPLSAPAVLMNGVFVYDFESKQVIKYCKIDSVPYKRVLDAFDRHTLHPNVFSFDGEKLSIQCTGIDTD
ncbi:MAG: HAD family hydrolase, partial [Oscillospiraceae bacterium]|nr:HAD family hydrolase [Oscillospiraceae bacterium]